MRILYFIITSSLMIGLMLLFRRFFRKKLSANVIYGLWFIVFLRLLIPFGYWDVPVFGTAAEYIYRPMTVMEQYFNENETKQLATNEETSKIESPVIESQPSAEGIKIYDAVIPGTATTKQENSYSENNVAPSITKETSVTPKTIILSISLAGSLVAAGYVIFQNRKLRKQVDTMEVIDYRDGIDICVSKDIKTPCLFGLHNPKIIVTEAVLADAVLYEYTITHELEHYRHKDHIYNADRIFMCILYWWNPLVWYAAKCVSEDAELACDERVLKNKTADERKKYGYALLQMMENAQNSPFCMATSYFGGKNTTKQRIESIARKTKTRKYVLIPAILVLVVLNIAGCVYPSEKSYIKTYDWNIGETEEIIYNEAKYEYSLQNDFQSMLFYYETYEFGELTERTILSYGELEKYSADFLLREESYKFEEKHHFIFEMDGIEVSIPIPQIDENRSYAGNHLYCENEMLEIKPNDDLILMASYQEKDFEIIKALSCEILATYDEEELKKVLKNHNVVTFARLILSDLPADSLQDKMRKEVFPEMLSLDEYNEKYSNKEFSTEPEENKVCLAVMPDGISKSGGDYRYIIPEDQVKWIDYYKQARSLTVDGAWKDGECSAGIWIVFNDEWTCITDRGMIFDFDKRIEKEKIEDFYNLCIEEAHRYGTGTPINPVDFPEIISATLNYNGVYTVTDANILNDLRKMIYTSKEIRGGSSCPFTASLVLELKDNTYETIYLATDSCSAWLTDGVYYEYFGYENIEELSDTFEKYGEKIDANQTNASLLGNTANATKIIKQADEHLREGYKEVKLTYVDNAEVGWNYYSDNPWASVAERDALAQAALKELYTLTGFNVEECTYTTDGRSRFIFGKSASNIKKSIAFYSRDYGFTLCGDSTPYMSYVNARRVHYSDVQQLDSPYQKEEYSGHGAIAAWFLEHSGVYQGEKIIGFDAINLDDTVYTHIKLNFAGGYYIVVMDEKIESVADIMGPYYE